MKVLRCGSEMAKIFFFGGREGSSVGTALCQNGPVMQKLVAVPGYGNKKNDLLFYGELSKISAVRKHVVYFQGDVQSFSEEMEIHKSNWQWNKWNLEATARLLYKRFPESYIWIICPVRRHLGTYCCYDNFLHTDEYGRPLSLTEPQGSLLHLRELFRNAFNSLNKNYNPHATSTVTSNASGVEKDMALTVVGFSKGCLVLCQLLRDLCLAGLHSSSPEVNWFHKMVQHMYWLDGGCKAFSLREDMLKELSSLKAAIHVHTTPYQLQDPDRPIVRMEERIFVGILSQLGADITEISHFTNDRRSLSNHFSVLNVF